VGVRKRLWRQNEREKEGLGKTRKKKKKLRSQGNLRKRRTEKKKRWWADIREGAATCCLSHHGKRKNHSETARGKRTKKKRVKKKRKKSYPWLGAFWEKMEMERVERKDLKQKEKSPIGASIVRSEVERTLQGKTLCVGGKLAKGGDLGEGALEKKSGGKNGIQGGKRNSLWGWGKNR